MASCSSAMAEVAVSAHATKNIITFFIVLLLLLKVNSSVRAYFKTANHAGLKVPWQQASKVKAPGSIEGPDQRLRLARGYVRHIGLVMLHPWKLFHERGMLFQLRSRAQYQFMQHFPFVFNYQFQRLTLSHFEMIRGKAHVVVHAND